jgi:solute carrier family 35 protein E1
MAGAPDSVALLLFFVFWYVGNMYYNQYNTQALAGAGGKHGGLTMTVSTLQLGVCTVYALVLWIVTFNPIKIFGLQTPERMRFPKVTAMDLVSTIPVAFCSAAAHSAGVFCLGADPLFGQIVKSGEPVLAAIVNTVFYGKPPSFAKWLMLIPIVGGVAFASLKKGADGTYALKFDETALLFGMIGNTFAAFKGSETKKLMTLPGLKDRMGGVGNQFALTECLAFLVSLPVMWYTEGAKWPVFWDLLMTNRDLQIGLAISGMSFYLYNELATLTIKATGAVTSSVANTAKRVIVMVYMAAVTGKVLTEEQKIGAAVAIGGVLVYSVIDDLIKALVGGKKDEKKTK